MKESRMNYELFINQIWIYWVRKGYRCVKCPVKEVEKMIYKCIVCDKEVPDYIPEYCCNGLECNCHGQPIEPPVCSEDCWNKLLSMGKDIKEVEK